MSNNHRPNKPQALPTTAALASARHFVNPKSKRTLLDVTEAEMGQGGQHPKRQRRGSLSSEATYTLAYDPPEDKGPCLTADQGLVSGRKGDPGYSKSVRELLRRELLNGNKGGDKPLLCLYKERYGWSKQQTIQWVAGDTLLPPTPDRPTQQSYPSVPRDQATPSPHPVPCLIRDLSSLNTPTMTTIAATQGLHPDDPIIKTSSPSESPVPSNQHTGCPETSLHTIALPREDIDSNKLRNHSPGLIGLSTESSTVRDSSPSLNVHGQSSTAGESVDWPGLFPASTEVLNRFSPEILDEGDTNLGLGLNLDVDFDMEFDMDFDVDFDKDFNMDLDDVLLVPTRGD